MKKIIASVVILSFLVGCSNIPTLDDIVPDKRKKYRKSRDLPALEIPPDLTTERVGSGQASDGSSNDATSLSEFQQQQATSNVAAISGEQALLPVETDETRITIPQTAATIWPKLSSELKDNGYLIDVEDSELGVLETLWKNNNPDLYGVVSRNKVRVVAERGTNSRSTVLFISSQVELNRDNEWANTGPDRELEKELAAKIGEEFDVNTGSAVSDYVANSGVESAAEADFARAPAPSKAKATVKTNFSDNLYMVIPQEYDIAYPSMQRLFDKAGMTVKSNDEEKGTYDIYFTKTAESNWQKEQAEEEEKGFFSKLKFWGDGKDALEVGEGRAYTISLTGVGDKTEVVALDVQGDWTSDDGAKDVLYTLMETYNK